MYWSKIATTQNEFNAIAALNYETGELNGFSLHGASNYLKQKNLAQISTIQPSFEKDFKKMNELFSFMKDIL